MNNAKLIFLLGLLTGLFLSIGYMTGGRQGMVVALILAVVMNFVSYWFSDKIILKSYRARELQESEEPRIFAMVQELSQKAGIPMPKLYVIDEESPNAFATGRNPSHAAVALTRGIMQLMKENELKGVIAHELSHVFNHDTLISCVAASLAGAILFLIHQLRWLALFGGGNDDDNRGGNPLTFLLMVILAPIAAMLIQMAISRSREFKADSSAAHLSHDPEGLATALEKLDQYSRKIMLNASHQTAHLFIVSPFSGKKSLLSLFSTHPPIEERVSRLRSFRFS